MGLLPSSSSSKICIYPNCNQRKEGKRFECCPDHHCAHFETNITCFKARTRSSTACDSHTCRHGDGECKSPVEGKDTDRCSEHRYQPADDESVASNESDASSEDYHDSDDDAAKCVAIAGCTGPVDREGDACEDHTCSEPGCNLPAWWDYDDDEGACREHSCSVEDCYKWRFKDDRCGEHAYTTPLCRRCGDDVAEGPMPDLCRDCQIEHLEEMNE